MNTSPSPHASCPNGFTLRRGVNISHWLSQRDPETPPEPGYFSEVDAGFLRSCGFDHIRLPVDEMILWDADGARRQPDWERFYGALEWCERHDLRVIVDLHIIRAHYFNAHHSGTENTLWTSEAAQKHLVDLWMELSAALESYPNDRIAYEIMNEPIAPEAEMWNVVAERVHGAIREREAERTILIGPNMWQKIRYIPELRLPKGDPNVILSFHYYTPGMVTHYKAPWTALKEYDGPVQYPGVPFPAEALPHSPSEEFSELLGQENHHYDREVIRGEIVEAAAFAKSYGIPAHCGEWGCYRFTDKAMRLRWYRDVRSSLEELGVGWSIWDYKGGFRIVDPESHKAETDLIDLLMDRETEATLS